MTSKNPAAPAMPVTAPVAAKPTAKLKRLVPSKPMAAMGKSTGWMATMEKNPQRRLMAYWFEKVGFSAAVLDW